MSFGKNWGICKEVDCKKFNYIVIETFDRESSFLSVHFLIKKCNENSSFSECHMQEIHGTKSHSHSRKYREILRNVRNNVK